MKKIIGTFIILTTISLNIMAQQKIVQTAGRTQLGEFATDAQEILPGTVIHIPANVKHWHGAAKTAGLLTSPLKYLARIPLTSGWSLLAMRNMIS